MGVWFTINSMKTTLEILDHLLRRAKALAVKRKVTLRDLAEEGLRRVLEADQSRTPPRVHPVTMKGRGLSAEFQSASWAQIRDAAYGMR
jgi:hypothetical protein